LEVTQNCISRSSVHAHYIQIILGQVGTVCGAGYGCWFLNWCQVPLLQQSWHHSWIWWDDIWHWIPVRLVLAHLSPLIWIRLG